jgi:hypothetical protein
MSEKIHDCGYVFSRFIEVGTVPVSVLESLKEVIAHVECPRCKAHVDLTIIVAFSSDGEKKILQ